MIVWLQRLYEILGAMLLLKAWKPTGERIGFIEDCPHTDSPNQVLWYPYTLGAYARVPTHRMSDVFALRLLATIGHAAWVKDPECKDPRCKGSNGYIDQPLGEQRVPLGVMLVETWSPERTFYTIVEVQHIPDYPDWVWFVNWNEDNPGHGCSPQIIRRHEWDEIGTWFSKMALPDVSEHNNLGTLGTAQAFGELDRQ